MALGRQIKSLNDLKVAAQSKRSVIVPNWWGKPRPAAFILCFQGGVLCNLFNEGMFLYEKESKNVERN